MTFNSALLTLGSALVLFAGAAPACYAGPPLTGRVIGLADGDTITVLDSSHVQHKVRVAGIDAPEKGQPFGKRSKAHLSLLVMGKTVHVEGHKKDRYGRVVGMVKVADSDAGLEQVRAGMAWHYKLYSDEQRPHERAAYAEAENEARTLRRGLWADKLPQAPWDYRAAQRQHGRR